MRSKKEIIAKRRKLRKRLRKAIYDYGTTENRENCRYWVPGIDKKERCVYNELESPDGEKGLRCCPEEGPCLNFKRKYTNEDLEKRYLDRVNDQVYLANNYRDLFILNWVLEDEPESEGFLEWLKKKMRLLW